MLRNFRTVQMNDKATAMLQDNVEDFVSQLETKPQLDSVILENISLTSGVINNVPHKLGRKFVGWQVIDMPVDCRVWRDTSAGQLDLFVPLRTSATGVFKIIVF